MKKRDYKYSPEMNHRFYLVRTALGKTQSEMGPTLGYSTATFSKLEKAGYKIEEKMVLLMCSVYDVSYEYLVYGEEPMFKTETIERKAWMNLYDALPKPYKDMFSVMTQALLDKLSKDADEKDTPPTGE